MVGLEILAAAVVLEGLEQAQVCLLLLVLLTQLPLVEEALLAPPQDLLLLAMVQILYLVL